MENADPPNGEPPLCPRHSIIPILLENIFPAEVHAEDVPVAAKVVAARTVSQVTIADQIRIDFFIDKRGYELKISFGYGVYRYVDSVC